MQKDNLQHNEMSKFIHYNWPSNIKSFKHQNILLSKQVVNYLTADQIFVNSIWKKGEAQSDEQGIRFPELEQMITNISNEYEEMFVKLNWRAPSDCRNWHFELKCHDLYDIMLSLKSSGIIMEMLSDYEEQFQDYLQPEMCQLLKKNEKQTQKGFILEIRKFYKLKEQNEFRCFILNNEIKAISQKNLFIINNSNKNEIKEKITYFFQQKLKELLLDYQSYVIDLYLDINDQFIIVDINPYQEHTRSKLFTYSEIDKFKQCEIRLVENQNQIIQEDYSEYKIEIEDIINMKNQIND